MRTLIRIGKHALHHFHEITPAVIVEFPHLSIQLGLLLIAVLICVFYAQTITQEG